MQGKEFEFEERHIPVSVGLTFHGFDFVVDAFEFAVGDVVVVPGEDAVTVTRKGVGNACNRFEA